MEKEKGKEERLFIEIWFKFMKKERIRREVKNDGKERINMVVKERKENEMRMKEVDGEEEKIGIFKGMEMKDERERVERIEVEEEEKENDKEIIKRIEKW